MQLPNALTFLFQTLGGQNSFHTLQICCFMVEAHFIIIYRHRPSWIRYPKLCFQFQFQALDPILVSEKFLLNICILQAFDMLYPSVWKYPYIMSLVHCGTWTRPWIPGSRCNNRKSYDSTHCLKSEYPIKISIRTNIFISFTPSPHYLRRI